MMVVIIDITNLIPGKGGSGGGIWVYAKNLLTELDKLANIEGLKIICLKNDSNYSISLLNIEVKSFHVNNQNFLKRMLWLHLRLPVLCKKYKADVVHRVVPEIPLFTKVKVVCTLHDFMFDFYMSKREIKRYLSIIQWMRFGFIKLNTLWSVLFANHVIVPSKAVFDQLNSKYWKRMDFFHVIHESADNLSPSLQEYHKRGKICKSHEFKIVVVAAFFKHKGHKFVIELARQLVAKGVRNFHITFRGNEGDRNWSATLNRIIKKEGLDDYFSINLFSEKLKIEEIYGDFQCLLLLSEYEGFGIPVLEAQRMGVPVVCSDLRVFREILGDSAFYFPLSDIDQFGERFMAFMQDGDMRQELINRGHENVKRFSWSKMAEQTIDVYYGCNREMNKKCGHKGSNKLVDV